MVKIDYESLQQNSVEQLRGLEETIERNIRREFERKRAEEEEAARKKRKKRKRKQRKTS